MRKIVFYGKFIVINSEIDYYDWVIKSAKYNVCNMVRQYLPMHRKCIDYLVKQTYHLSIENGVGFAGFFNCFRLRGERERWISFLS